MVAEGYSGDGHTVTLKSGYVVEGVLFESDAARYDSARSVIVLTTEVMGLLNLAVTATVDCASGRNCAPILVTVSPSFSPSGRLSIRRCR